MFFVFFPWPRAFFSWPFPAFRTLKASGRENCLCLHRYLFVAVSMWIPKFMVKWLFRIITRKSTVSEKQKWYWNTFYVVRSKALFCKVTVTGRGVPGNHTQMAPTGKAWRCAYSPVIGSQWPSYLSWYWEKMLCKVTVTAFHATFSFQHNIAQYHHINESALLHLLVWVFSRHWRAACFSIRNCTDIDTAL